VPLPVRGSRHSYKYRFALIVNDVCVMRYDNEAGKGDHRHAGSQEFSYDSEDWNALGMTFLSAQESGSPRTLLIEVRSLEQVREDFTSRLAKGPDRTPRMTFPSYALFYKLLSPNRLQVLATMAGGRPISIRELARRVGRDFKGVHTDVTALLSEGLVEKTEDGAIRFPFAGVHIDFHLGGEAQSAA